jgi:TetR/AcrR family transcriptional regulator, fatty acid metabolism regulator protein
MAALWSVTQMRTDSVSARPKDDRKTQILQAATRVFAQKGFHACRISDIAEEAGVAYGLVYHYFSSKEGLLAAIFDNNWAFFGRTVDEIAGSAAPMKHKVAQIMDIAFQAFEMAPLTVKVMVLEFGRQSRLGEALDNPRVQSVFDGLSRIFADGKQNHELHPLIDPHAMGVIFMGALETIFVSSVWFLDHKDATHRAHMSLPAMKQTLLAIVERRPGDGHAV